MGTRPNLTQNESWCRSMGIRTGIDHNFIRGYVSIFLPTIVFAETFHSNSCLVLYKRVVRDCDWCLHLDCDWVRQVYGWEFNTAALPGHYCTECGHKRSTSPSGIYTSLFLYYERKWTGLFFCHTFKSKRVIWFRFLFFTCPIMILLFCNLPKMLLFFSFSYCLML